MNEPSLADHLRDAQFRHRLDQAEIIALHDNEEQRAKAALEVIRETARRQVFDKLTEEQRKEIASRLEPLAYPNGGSIDIPNVFDFSKK